MKVHRNARYFLYKPVVLRLFGFCRTFSAKERVQMAGRRRLPSDLGRLYQETVRLTKDEQLDFQAAAYLLRRYRSDVLREAVYELVEDAKRLDAKKFAHLRKIFAEGNKP